MGFLILIAFYIQYIIEENTKTLQKSEISKANQYAARITNYIQNYTCAPLSTCLDNSISNRSNLNKMLHAFQTKHFINMFILYKDAQNNFRFLLDGDTNDPTEYKSLFFPETHIFHRIYKSGIPEIIKQHGDVKQVWASLLYPIRDGNRTSALLVLDLSKTYEKQIKSFNSPIQHIVHLLQLFIFFSIIFLGYVAYSSYRLRKSILIDPLTGAYTRLYRKEYFEEHQENTYDFILIDIDKFIQINDKFGRDIADKALYVFVKYLKGIAPENTKIIRNHGAEFLLILEKSETDLAKFSHILFENLSTRKYLIDNHSISFTITMCAAKTPDEVDSFYDMEHILDKKLLELKGLGKNRLAILDQISHIDIKYKNIDHVKHAIDNGQLTCLFQPIYHAGTMQVYSYEALVRIMDEDDPSKLVTPYYFMDLIRDSIHYIRLSRWVINHAFLRLRENPKETISINMDLADLYNEEMMDIIQEELETNQDLASRLTFEILEHNEITDFEHIDLTLNKLKQYGSKIAIDDFGSGYSNFVYLAKLDIDIIKIDSTLVKELENDNEKVSAIIKLINEMGKSQNTKVVAEHVSSKKILDSLLALDVEYLQGFYLGEPKYWEAYHPPK
jgi:diguanylate cyclase (GGDEF)-like protein